MAFATPATAIRDVERWTNEAKRQAELRANRRYNPYPEFNAKLYIMETGASDGICQYFVKVSVGGVSYVHINMYVGLNPDVLHVYVAEIKENMTEDDPLVPFEIRN